MGFDQSLMIDHKVLTPEVWNMCEFVEIMRKNDLLVVIFLSDLYDSYGYNRVIQLMVVSVEMNTVRVFSVIKPIYAYTRFFNSGYCTFIY